MGVALADEARRRGARVTLLAANLARRAPAGVEVVATPTAADLEREALARGDADVILMAAAVADYRPASAGRRKRPKDGATWTIELDADGRHRPRARRRAARPGRCSSRSAPSTAPRGSSASGRCCGDKNVDLVVYNDVGRGDIGFDSPDNEVTLITADGDRVVPQAPKPAIAGAILDEVERLLEGR